MFTFFVHFKESSHFSQVTNGKTAVNEVEEGGLRVSFNFFFKRAILATAQGIFFYPGHHHRHNNHQVIQTRKEHIQNGAIPIRTLKNSPFNQIFHPY